MRRTSVEQRFWAKVQGGDPEQCWLWTGAHSAQGYGSIFVNGRGVPAHRWAYESLRAEIPDGLHIDHLCSNPPCVNPWHLEPVTQQVNQQRIVERGRHPQSPARRAVERGIPFSYRRIADDLRARIAAGEFHPGDQLPTLAQSAQHYRNAALTTVQKAVLLLQSEGVVVGVQGAGLYVAQETR